MTRYAVTLPPAPCDDCPRVHYCREAHTACVDLLRYIESDNTPKAALRARNKRQPTREIYELIYCGIDLIRYASPDRRGREVWRAPPELKAIRRRALASIREQAR